LDFSETAGDLKAVGFGDTLAADMFMLM
jgi:hypothetical protein